MENSLCLALIQNHVFVGKAIQEFPDILADVVEFIPMVNNAGGVNFIGVVLGELTIPKDATIIKVSKESPYWAAYYKTSSKIRDS